MRYAQLRAFHAVATWGGFSKAAEKLHLSQPALSDHVRKLEDAYGVELFRRSARSVTMTEVGRRLYELTGQQFEAEAAALELLSRARGLQVGQVTVGADAAVHVLPLILAFRARYPGLSIKVIAGNSETLIQQLDRFEIDFAVVAAVAPLPRYATRLLSEDRLVAFVARTHPLARRRQVSFQALMQETFILREPGSVTRRLVEEEMARQGLSPATAIEIEGREAAREAVAVGLGVGVVSQSEFVDDPRLARIPFSDWDARMREWLVCLESRTGTQTIRAMLEVADHGK